MAYKVGLSRIVGALPVNPAMSQGVKKCLKKKNKKFLRRHYTEVMLQEEYLEMAMDAEEDADNYALEHEAFLWECRESEDVWFGEYLDHLDRKGPEEIAALMM